MIAIIGVFALNFGRQADYSTLFTGLNGDEAKEVVTLLQDEGIDYKFSDREGTIRVPSKEVDKTRAELLSKGYPKSGFTYDMYRDNAGMMTTESDKKQYTLYELQDRLGAQIRLFDGVKDAKVTIAEAGEQKYALDDENSTNASASVVVTMADGRSLGANEAAAIKNLITRAVRGMTFTNVAVFDAATMLEVGSSGDDGSLSGGRDMTALTTLVENNIAVNIRRVLEMIYGHGNVAVSVKGSLNMEKLIRESTEYATPEKVGEQDKAGLLYEESVINENSAITGQGAGGVVGADANADTPQYTNQTENGQTENNYANSSATREWLYNIVKEQRQVDPGVLENTTVGIVINTEDTSVAANDLLRLVADSAGIARDQAEQNITIIRTLAAGAPGAQGAQEADGQPVVPPKSGLPLPIIIAMIAGGVIILLLLLLLLLGRRSRKKQAAAAAAEAENFELAEELAGESPSAFESLPPSPEDEEMTRNEEILNLRMQHSLKLKQNIGDFVDQNPQIAAKLVQSWLRGEVELGGGKARNDTKRKSK